MPAHPYCYVDQTTCQIFNILTFSDNMYSCGCIKDILLILLFTPRMTLIMIFDWLCPPLVQNQANSQNVHKPLHIHLLISTTQTD